MKNFVFLGVFVVLISSAALAGRFERALKSGEKIVGEVVKKASSGRLVTPGFKPDKPPPPQFKVVDSTRFPTRVKWIDYWTLDKRFPEKL